MTMTKQANTAAAPTKRQLKAKAARANKQAAISRVMTIAFKGLLEGIEYKEDPKTGERVRLNGAKTRDEMARFLRGRRGYDYRELEEEIGTNWERYMVQQGYAVEYIPGSRIYLLKTKAVKTYDLPAVLPNGCPGAYVRIAA